MTKPSREGLGEGNGHNQKDCNLNHVDGSVRSAVEVVLVLVLVEVVVK